jgi:hypothetical protein
MKKEREYNRKHHCEKQGNFHFVRLFVYSFIYLSAFVIFYSCETPISLKIPGKEDTKIIEGCIENGKPAVVVISKSLAYFSSVSVETILAAIDTNAIVKVSDDMGNTEQLQRLLYIDILKEYTEFLPDLLLHHSFMYFLISDIATNPVDALSDPFFLFQKLANQRHFAYIGKTIKGIPGHTYSLYVESAGKVYTAQTTIPLNTVQIDSFALYRIENDTTATLRLFGTDRAETYDCYRFFLKIDKLDWHYESIYMGAFDDLTFNGLSVSYEMLRRPQANISISGMSRAAREDYYRSTFKMGDTIHIKSALTDKAAIDYWFPLQTDIATGSNPFMTPGTYISNIKGENVTGIWSGYHTKYDTVRFNASTILY